MIRKGMVGQGRVWKGTEGYGRERKGMLGNEGYGRAGKGMEGLGRVW